jgi:hypothetical protein
MLAISPAIAGGHKDPATCTNSALLPAGEAHIGRCPYLEDSMAILTTEALLQQAKDGQKLDVEDRRRVMRYLMYIQPEMTNVDAGELFQVTEATIRKDRKVIREEMAEELKTEDVGLVVSDIAFNFRRQLRDLEASKAKCKMGTKEYVQHCQAILKIELDKTKMFQELGFLPKNLGNMTIQNYEYAAVVIKGDQIESRPLTMFDDNTQNHIQSRGQQALSDGGETIEGEVLAPEG